MNYKVQTQPGGHEFSVTEGETLLDAALRQGLGFPYNCRGGGCGVCKGRIIAGVVDHGASTEKVLPLHERDAGLALFCQARPLSDLIVEIHEVAAGEVKPKKFPCRVVRMEKLAPDVMRLFLKLPPNDRLQFRAGQYIDILLRDGRRRSFSLANAPHADELLELHVRHVPGGEFTDHVFNRMQEKELLRIEGPYGQFYLREDAPRPMIFMAGGTGFAPIKGVIEHAFAEGLHRPMYFYWGVRAVHDLYLDELPRRWAGEYEDFHYIPVLSAPVKEGHWRGRTGFVHTAVLEDFADLSGYDVYACGPPVMIQAGRDAFVSRGLPQDHYYYDSFDYAPRVPKQD